MLVKFKNNWFSPQAVLYEKGIREYNGPEEVLPSTARIMSENERPPVRENSAKPDADVPHQTDVDDEADLLTGLVNISKPKK